jgi:uncharacterized protein
VSGTIAVTVAYAARGIETLVRVELSAAAVVADAVAASGILDRHELDPRALGYAIFGRRAAAATPLCDGDRVELTRALVADPKDARRQRAAQAPLSRPRPKARKRAR